MRYSEIKTMDQLESCQKQLQSQIGNEGSSIASSFASIKQDYSPVNLLTKSLGSVSEVIPFRQLLLNVVRFMIRKIRNR